MQEHFGCNSSKLHLNLTTSYLEKNNPSCNDLILSQTVSAQLITHTVCVSLHVGLRSFKICGLVCIVHIVHMQIETAKPLT